MASDDVITGVTGTPNRVADVSLKEYIETRLRILEALGDEREKRNIERFAASEKASEIALTAARTATDAAFSASEKAINAAFEASEKAIVKAEGAQKDYNAQTNEFRGQLNDQASTLMPRREAEANNGQLRELIDRLAIQVTELERSLRAEIAGLRESRSEGTGRDIHTGTTWQRIDSGMYLFIGLLIVAATLYVAIHK